MRFKPAIKLLLLPLILSGSIGLAHADGETTQGVTAAKAWLELVDSKRYKESWIDAAPFFKERVPEKDWVKMVSLARAPFGDVKSRELKNATYATSLPGAPDGAYVVIQFKTSFANKADAIETITPMKDAKGDWRVSGYFIK